MRAVILVGHGSLREGSGEAMFRLAGLAQARELAPIVEAAFLNFNRPSFRAALERCLRLGVTEIVVQPYFLIPGYYVQEALPKLVSAAKADHPEIRITVTEAFGYHPALSELVLKRADAVSTVNLPAEPLGEKRALLLMAHGTPEAEATAPIQAIANDIRARGVFDDVAVGFLELNRPGILEAIDSLMAKGIRYLTAVPYFLQLGNHVAEDLPVIISTAQKHHPELTVRLAEHLGYDPLLLKIIRHRGLPMRCRA